MIFENVKDVVDTPYHMELESYGLLGHAVRRCRGFENLFNMQKCELDVKIERTTWTVYADMKARLLTTELLKYTQD